MTKVLLTESSLANIGNAIRGKNGQTTRYKPDEMVGKNLVIIANLLRNYLSINAAGAFPPFLTKSIFYIHF